jgi:uncharacterized membrane protein
MTPKHILSGIAIIVAVAGLIWPSTPLVAVAVVLVAVANFLP